MSKRINRWLKEKLRLLDHRQPLALRAAEQTHKKFAEHVKTGLITIPQRNLFDQDDVFFTMGSCFAEEVRIGLTKRGLQCTPDYKNIVFDQEQARVDELPEREHMNFYNSFTILQQLRQAFGDWDKCEDDVWKVKKRGKSPKWGPDTYQDPYRRLVMANSPSVLMDVVDSINTEVRSGVETATAFVFTFGMTEVFRNKTSGKVVAQKPLYGGAGGAKETELHVSTFEENYQNVREIVNIVRKHKGNAPIIMSVSPVPLARTFQDDIDIVSVSCEGKSILRAVLGQITREMSDVYYLPSYEFVMARGTANFQVDQRHVRREVVDNIVQSFVDGFFDKNRAEDIN